MFIGEELDIGIEDLGKEVKRGERRSRCGSEKKEKPSGEH